MKNKGFRINVAACPQIEKAPVKQIEREQQHVDSLYLLTGSLKNNNMKNIVLYFPDAVNLRAFVLVENLDVRRVDQKSQQLKGFFSKQLYAKAIKLYGAIEMPA